LKINNILWIFVILILINPVFAIEETFYEDVSGKTFYPNIEIVKLRYEPYPVKPGDYFDLWLEVQNTGEDPAEDFIITFVENYPFFLDPSEKPLREVAFIDGKQVVVFKYKVRVDERAVEEDAELKVRFKHGGIAWETQSFDISIETVSPVFYIETSTEPDRLKQGKVGKLNFKLTNSLTSVMRDITLKLDLDDLPFTPVGSSVERKIGSIASNSFGKTDFDIMPSPKAASGVYKIPLTVTYYDKSGAQYTKEDIVGVLVDDDAEFQLNLEESEVVMERQAGKVVVSISNIAESDVKFLSIELLGSDYYRVLSNPRVYIGNLEADDYETAEFDIYVRDSVRGKTPLKFLINYKDPFNEAHSDVKNIGLPIYNYFQATSFGLVEKKFSIFNLLLTLLAIFFVFRTYKEWRKQRDIEVAVKITAIKFYRYGKEKSILGYKYMKKYLNKNIKKIKKKNK